MTIDEATRQLGSIGVHLPPPPPPSRRHLDAIAKIKREHAAKVAAIKEKADTRISDAERHRQELLAESRLHRQLLREETAERIRQDDRVEIHQRQGYRRFLEGLRTSLGPTEQKQLEDEIAGTIDDSSNPDVRRIAAHLQETWQREQIDVLDVRDPRVANGSACRKLRWISVSLPIKNLRLAVIAEHETAHLLHPDVADAREVTGADGFSKVCVAHEIAAWRWVLDNVPAWNEQAHSDMTRFLNSYASYATEQEAAAIKGICSQLSFYDVQLRLAIGQ